MKNLTLVVFVSFIMTGWLAAMYPLRSAPAQSTAPTIAQIQANPNAFIDQIVTISGTSGRFVDDNEFLLDDGTGQIVIDPGPPWYRQIVIPSGTSITVTGQIDWMGPPGARRVLTLTPVEL
ncbi:MAG: hypothetical protein ACUVSY_11785 [Roseiflexus sp.]